MSGKNSILGPPLGPYISLYRVSRLVHNLVFSGLLVRSGPFLGTTADVCLECGSPHYNDTVDGDKAQILLTCSLYGQDLFHLINSMVSLQHVQKLGNNVIRLHQNIYT